MELWLGAIILGLLYALMSTGVYITFRVYNFPDITVDGSFTAGAAAAAALIVAGWHPALALVAALMVGAAAGAVTALIHTRFKINGLLAGILVMTGLYSINLRLMGRANIPLLQERTLFTMLDAANPGLPAPVWTLVALIAVMAAFWLIMAFFLKTDLGMAMRATGENPRMAAANSVNVEMLTILGLALANGLVGVSGALVAMYQGFADVTMGVGTVVVGLASVIIGESTLRARSLAGQVLSALVGSVAFRLMIALALYLGLNPIDLKLLTAGFVLLTLVVSQGVAKGRPKGQGLAARLRARPAWVLAAVLAALLGWWGAGQVLGPPAGDAGGPGPAAQAGQAKPLIGVLQITDNSLLDICREALVAELAVLGYQDGVTCHLRVENAHGDLAHVNLVLDKFLKDNVALVVTISTATTQAAFKKITDRPVVFTAVANPFIIKAGATERDHLPNVTGAYGATPMDKTLALVRELLPKARKVGAVWDPSQANSVFNATNLKREIDQTPGLVLAGATVASTGEVYQAVQSLTNQAVDVLVMPPDHLVYSAFDAVVSAARPSKTPIVLNDIERLGDGALASIGYDMVSSGQQGARLVARVLKGENPRDIPFERYTRLKVGLNLDVAAELGLTIPPEVLAQANIIYPPPVKDKPAKTAAPAAPAAPAPAAPKAAPAAKPLRVAIFYFLDVKPALDAVQGVMEGLHESGVMSERRIEVTLRSAQGDFPLGQSIAQDLMRQNVDLVVTITSASLQLMARFNKTIPHVFGAVTDPLAMGVAESLTRHPPNLTGIATAEPVASTIRTMREVFPRAKRLGMVWNPSEPASRINVLATREAAQRSGFEVLEATVAGTAEVRDAVQSLLGRGIDLFFTSGDMTIITTMESVAQMLDRAGVPLVTNSSDDAARGAMLAVGPNYPEVGRETGRIAARVIRGESPKDMPIQIYEPEELVINWDLVRKHGVNLPHEVRQRAANPEGRP
ncbi:MAG: ABC transporter substrate binding protein [Pseudomonadota bacterium]